MCSSYREMTGVAAALLATIPDRLVGSGGNGGDGDDGGGEVALL